MKVLSDSHKDDIQVVSRSIMDLVDGTLKDFGFAFFSPNHEVLGGAVLKGYLCSFLSIYPFFSPPFHSPFSSFILLVSIKVVQFNLTP